MKVTYLKVIGDKEPGRGQVLKIQISLLFITAQYTCLIVAFIYYFFLLNVMPHEK